MFWRRRKQEPATSQLFDPTSVDLITSDRSGVVTLYVVQDEPWLDSPEELESLLAKIRNYVAFATDGRLAARYPAGDGRQWRIMIDTYTGPPGDRTLEALRSLADELEGALILHELHPPTSAGVGPRTVRARRLCRGGDEDIEL
jgi:hypothetical protein